MRGKTTIYKQLIINVILPAVAALLLLGGLNYTKTRSLIVEANEEINRIISDEIREIHELQDLALGILDSDLNQRMEKLSSVIVEKIESENLNVLNLNLYDLRDRVGMDPIFEDIYFIDTAGTIVNTTFNRDSGLNFFEFGEKHKALLLEVFKKDKFVAERFTIENQTKRIKKFTYEPVLNGNYILELGAYSPKADEIIQVIKNRINYLSTMRRNIRTVNLFIGADNPFSLNADVNIKEEHMPLYRSVLEDQKTAELIEKSGRYKVKYKFIYMERKDSDLYKAGVIQIVTDDREERMLLKNEMFKFIIIFGLTLIVVILLIYRKTKVITDPIKKLADSVVRITDGHLNERAAVVGNNEITTLSEQFNAMIEQLEAYTNELEEMVKERTAEIERQKEEIEAQRDSLQEQRNILAETNDNLQKAYMEIEEQKKHVEDSIHYASRIQNAILPPDSYVQEIIPNSFVLYLPKDIVSGDFYWMTKKKEYVMVAAVDCTGHGVPGAFMSIVGNNQLNYAVNVLGKRKPGEILDALNEGVSHTLRQSRRVSSVKDGMDLALVTYNTRGNTLAYAGAFNPLLLVRDNEMTVYRADKFPIGSYYDDPDRHYTNHEIKLEKNDMIYIFSDGYPDQFGGPENRKFMSKKFRQMLLDIHANPMDKQKEILKDILVDWKGDQQQVDDILVIGIRF